MAGAAAAVGRVGRHRATLAGVAPELRSPMLLVPLPLTSDRGLRVVRALTSLVKLVTHSAVDERHIRTDDGRQVRVLCFHPAERSGSSGALLWLHGGGLVMGNAELSTEWCQTIARDVGLVVISVDYRLAPEDPFPAALDDCTSALRWLVDAADELGIDVDRIAVGGDSAGGGLAAALAQRARDEGGPPIAFQLLVYPMLDDRTVLRTDHQGRGALMWTPETNRYGWTSYLGHAPTEADERPHAAPGRTSDLRSLPPAWIGVGDLDLFYEEDVDYARRLDAVGVACELHIAPGMYHGADAIVPGASICRAFRGSATNALRAAIGG